MKKLEFKQSVKSSAENAFNKMLGIPNINTYEKWTAEFNPTSTYEGNWEKDSKILFVGQDEKGNKGGMVARIADIIPGKFVSIQHYGILEGDKEITEGEKVESWAGGLENYHFEEKNGVTTIRVELDMIEEYMDYFKETWPKALLKLKEVIEN